MNNEKFTNPQRFIYGAGGFLFGLIVLAILSLFGIKNSIITLILFIVPFFIGYLFPKLGRDLSKFFAGWALSSKRSARITPNDQTRLQVIKDIGEGEYDKDNIK